MDWTYSDHGTLRLGARLLGVILLGAIVAAGEVTAAQFTLRWTDNSTNETGFRIERSTNGSTFGEIATVGANIVSYVDAGLPDSTSYWYRLRAYNAAGNSAYSNVATGSTPPPASNSSPAITNIANQTINAGSNIGALAFTVADVETAVGGLTVSGSSSNTTLVPNANIVFGGSGSSRTVTVTPASGQSGTATITVTVSDGSLTASDSFVLTVNAVNTAPTITDITNRTINEDATTGAVAFTVADTQTSAGSLTASGSSSNTTLVPNANIVFGGSGSIRTVTVTPAANQSGTATITVTVSDGSLTVSDSFVLTVSAMNDAPTVSNMADRTISEDANTGAVSFTVGDVETSAGSLTVSGTSSNTTLVPNENIAFGGNGSSRTVTVTPAANQSGTATITVTVSDGFLTANDSFVLNVNSVDTAPTITDIANQTVNEDNATGAISFTIGDAQTAAGNLTVSGSSSNRTLVPLSGVVLGGSGASRTVTVTPASNQTGSSTITITVSDGSLSTSTTFVVTVGSAPSGPTITSQPQALTITPGSSMTLSVAAQSSSALSYQWFFNGSAIAGATASTYTIPLAQRYDAGTYHVVVTAGGTSVTSSSAVVSAGTVASTGRLSNLSARAQIQTGNNVLINGFVISGSVNKRVLLRAVGPTLTSFGISGFLPDPKLVLKRQTTSGYVDVATNLDWADGGNTATLRQAFTQVSAFDLPDSSGDAVLLLDLAPGVYSVFAADEVSTRTGVSIVELYDANATSGGARMTNISNRGFLGTGNDVMVTGFVITGGTTTLLLRTVGPGLAQFGLSGTIVDPRMQVFRRINGTDVALLENDDWGSSGDSAYTQQVTQQVSAFALAAGSKDSAIVVSLPEGVYSLVSQGAGQTTGLAIVELYAVP